MATHIHIHTGSQRSRDAGLPEVSNVGNYHSSEAKAYGSEFVKEMEAALGTGSEARLQEYNQKLAELRRKYEQEEKESLRVLQSKRSAIRAKYAAKIR